MAYLLSDGGSTVIEYPYDLLRLLRDNPGLEFSASPTDVELAEYNMFPVAASTPSPYSILTHDLNEVTPVLIGSVWTQAWEITAVDQAVADVRQAAVDAYEARLGSEALLKAEQLLEASSVYVLEAFETSKELHPDFLAYRTALRDPSLLPGYPYNIEFPAVPPAVFIGVVDLSETFEDNI